MKHHFLYILLPLVIIGSCKSGPTDEEKIEKTVRNYYFLDDTTDVTIEIKDTLYIDLVSEMFAKVQENLRLVQLDIDTLNTIIDQWSYEKIKGTDSTGRMVSVEKKLKAAQLELKLTNLKAKKDQYLHTRRIINHLRRDVWADIAGFNAAVTFHSGEMVIQDEVLLSGDFDVVD